MLRNRSRAVTTKQALMADHHSPTPSPTKDYTTPITSFFNSPRFKALTTKTLFETESIKSPTSILDKQTLFPFGNNPLLQDSQTKSPKSVPDKFEKLDPKGICLALVDDQPIEDDNDSAKPTSKMVLFGAKLRVHIPPLPPTSTISPTDSPKSPADFGIKTRNSGFGSGNSGVQIVKDYSPLPLSVSEMELSEDYTCVISHGPNPKTTHIFDDCVVEETYCCLSEKSISSASDKNFLSFCYTCKKNLDQKDDIYIYRGEQAFCSRECRYQEMLLDGMEN